MSHLTTLLKRDRQMLMSEPFTRRHTLRVSMYHTCTKQPIYLTKNLIELVSIL